jgi:hypothetical protein
MSARRLLATLLFALLGAVALATPATAADYPPKRPPVMVTQNTVVTPGVTVLVLRGFSGKTPITITVTGGPHGPDTRSLGLATGTAARVTPSAFRLATAPCTVGATCQVTSDARGAATVRVSLTEAGSYVVSARGRSADGTMRTVSVALVVAGKDVAAADQNVSAGGLVHTGADLTTLWAGLGLVLAGTLFITVARSRRRILA